MNQIKEASLLAILVAGLAAAGCASTGGMAAPAVPTQLQAPAGQVLFAEIQATGVQIYACTASRADPAKYEWAFKAPEADLFDADGRKVGVHYAGPTWESNDRSKVVGVVAARDDAPDANAIPWLLLAAKPHGGDGLFGRTASIQRLHTVGGKAPAAHCDAKQAGTEVRVPYQAAYYFYAARS